VAENTVVMEKQSDKMKKNLDGGVDGDSIMNASTDGDSPTSKIIVEGLSIEDTETIISCLESVTRILRNAENIIAQPRRSLPSRIKVVGTQKLYSPYPDLYRMYSSCGLLEALFVLVSSPATGNKSSIFLSVKEMFTQFMASMSGMVYLSSKVETVNCIMRALTQIDENQEEGADDLPTQQLGISLVYHLQTLQLIDQLRKYHAKDSSEKQLDDAESLSILHNLFSLTLTPRGRETVVYMMGLDDNLGVLMPFIEFTGDKEQDAIMKRSATMGYVLQLLTVVLRSSNSVSMLEKYAAPILQLAEQDLDSKNIERMLELQEWLSPFQKAPHYEADNVAELARAVKQYKEEFSQLQLGLITTTRILKHIAVSPRHDMDEDHVEDLRCKFAVIELFSADCFANLAFLLQKCCEQVYQPYHPGAPPVKLFRLLAFAKPTVALLKSILSNLIKARGAEFKDLSGLPCLFSLYTVLKTLSATGIFINDCIAGG